MAYWTELPASAGAYRMFKGRYGVQITLGKDYTFPCTLQFLRYTSDATPGPLGWRPAPDNSITIVREEPWEAGNLEAGKALAKEVLERLASEGLWPGLSEVPFAFPTGPEPTVLGYVMHPGNEARAILLSWPDGRFEVRVHLLAEPGYCIPLVTPSLSSGKDDDREWGLAFVEQIWADDYESARAAADHYMEVALADYVEMRRNNAASDVSLN